MIKLNNKITNQNKKNTGYYLILALIPILSLYEFIPLINLGYLFLIIAIIFRVITKKFSIEINFSILIIMSIFLVSNLIVGMVKYADFTNTFNNTGSIILFTLLSSFICNPKTLNIDNFYRVTKFVGIIATLFLLYQFISYNLFDIVIRGNIPFLNPNEIGFKSIEYGRPTSFFLEPAHFALYISPVYALSLIKKEYHVSIILLLGLLFSTATTGIVLAILIPLIIIFDFRSKKSILIVILFILFLQPLTSLLSENLLSKISVDSWSSNPRIFGTLYVFKFFNVSEWIAGIGINRMTDYLGSYTNTLVGNYANSFIFVIISFGIIGLTTLIVSSVHIYKKIPKKYKVIWIILILSLISDQILFNRNLLYLLIWQYAAFDISNQAKNVLEA